MVDYKPRELVLRLSRALESMPVVVVSGMRQVGKTTMLSRDPSLAGRRFVNLDEFQAEQAARTDPASLLGKGEPVTIDEVQRVPELLRAIKLAVDSDGIPGRFLLSGSANLLLLASVSESLAGRALYLELGPLDRRELCGETRTVPFLVELLKNGVVPDRDRSMTLEMGAVMQGGMPRIAVGGADPATWFLGFEQTYLERDVRSMARIENLSEFRRFLRLVALRTGNIVNLSDLCRDSAISAATASRYLSLLEASFSVVQLGPFLSSRTSRLRKRPKVYMADSGLASHLAVGVVATAGGSFPFEGALIETYVAQNLRVILNTWLPGATLCYWSVAGRHEIDFVVEYGDRTLGIEVKRASRWGDHDLAGLRKFLQVTPSAVAAIIACNTESVASLGDRLFAAPLSVLLS